MVTANDVQNVLERVFGIHVAVKDFHVGNGSCSLQTERNELQKQVSKGTRSFHVRVSAFSYNTISDFQRLHNVLYNNISLTDHIKRNTFGLKMPYVPVKMTNRRFGGFYYRLFSQILT